MQVAARLKQVVREADTVARFGGDEFVVVVEQVADIGQLEAVARKILQVLEEPFGVEARDLYVTASIGIAFCEAGKTSVDILIAQADSAMYSAKESGRNNYQVHSPEMAQRAILKTDLESDLRSALHRNELTFHMQPIVSMVHGQTICLEALMRWESPTRGVVNPNQFISVLEDTGLIVPATQWLLREACRYVGADLRRAGPDIRFAVNLSAPCFLDRDLVAHLRQTIDEASIAPDRLTIEITESALFHNPRSVRPVLTQLKSLGVSIALDDFGTGQSSLSHLRSFPIDVVKIDREFVQDVPGDRHDSELVSAIVVMAHKLNMQVVAEGVENAAQRDFLRDLGCDSAQGYFYSPPLAKEALQEYLERATSGQTASA
jgi:predicted signal transduction protein with EAL and GGDEF domain